MFYKHNWEQIQIYAIYSENNSAMSNTTSIIVIYHTFFTPLEILALLFLYQQCYFLLPVKHSIIELNQS